MPLPTSANANAPAPILIVGGGPVGCVLALALAQRGIPSLLLEQQATPALPTVTNPTNRVPISRTIALSFGSRLLLEELGIWSYLSHSERATHIAPITRIEISEAASCNQSEGYTELLASAHGLPALGYTVAYDTLQHACWQAVQEQGQGKIDLRFGHQAQQISSTQRYAALTLQATQSQDLLTSPLIVIADGGSQSLFSSNTNSERTIHYQQTAVTAQIKATNPEPGLACERFTVRGPVALLPTSEGYTVIRTMPYSAKNSLLANDTEFLAELQADLAERVGTLEFLNERSFFPLALRYSRKIQGLRTIQIGNAAQSLHPIAGQGLNLGLRDAWQLAQTLTESKDPGDAATLSRYTALRRADRYFGIHFTHQLVKIFGQSPLSYWRRQGLHLLDSCWPLKKQLTHHLIFGL